MGSIRLTNEMRNRIAKTVLEHRLGPEEKEIELDRKKLGSLVYDTLYDKSTQGLMAKLPEGWLPTQCMVTRAEINALLGLPTRKEEL